MNKTLTFAFAILLLPSLAHADDAAIARYRKSWNPFSGGPELVSSADLHPQGQYFIRPYIYSELGYAQFGDRWSVNRSALPQRLGSTSPTTVGRSPIGLAGVGSSSLTQTVW